MHRVQICTTYLRLVIVVTRPPPSSAHLHLLVPSSPWNYFLTGCHCDRKASSQIRVKNLTAKTSRSHWFCPIFCDLYILDHLFTTWHHFLSVRSGSGPLSTVWEATFNSLTVVFVQLFFLPKIENLKVLKGFYMFWPSSYIHTALLTKLPEISAVSPGCTIWNKEI